MKNEKKNSGTMYNRKAKSLLETLGSLKRTIVEWIESIGLWKVLPSLKTLAISLPLSSIIQSKYNSSFPNE